MAAEIRRSCMRPRQPIPGAVLTLLDAGGRTLGRNITDEHGPRH